MIKFFPYVFICTLVCQGLSQLGSPYTDLKTIRRPIDGHNNNLGNPTWGGSNTLMDRMGDGFVNYQDGSDKPIRRLPNPRQISNKVGRQIGDFPPNKNKLSILFTIWGQFLDHDISLTPTQEDQKRQSMIIQIPMGDPDMDSTRRGDKKMNFIRSIFNKDGHPYRNQMNRVTAWVDGSQIYGSTQQVGLKLRAFSKGKLKQSPGGFLPKDNQGFFFQAGDTRVNENLALTSMHTLWMRQHNRLCNVISTSQPSWTDDQIYNTARNYVIGLIQKITYDDWLPKLVGQSQFDTQIGKYKTYDSQVKPTIQTQFSTSAFRIGHPLLPDRFPQVNSSWQTTKELQLSQMFMKPQHFKSQDSINDVLRGLISGITKQKSCSIVDGVRNLLVTDSQNRQNKLDLFSLNIQRSRDHGIPPYNKCRAKAGVPALRSFQGLTSNSRQVNNLESAYQSVDDMDLWVGIVCEEPSKDAVMGKVGAKIVTDAFKRLRNGDRFWYEFAYPLSIVKEIQKTTFADIIQRNLGITGMQPDVFVIRSGQKDNKGGFQTVKGILDNLNFPLGDLVNSFSSFGGRGNNLFFASFGEQASNSK